MILTEHQEQYDRKHERSAGRPTTEELVMIRDSIMLPHMLTMSDKALQDVKRSTNLFRRYFERMLQMLMDRISKELFTLRREMKARNIKVFDDETHDGIIYHRYVCRGYEDQFGIVRETLRSEISFRLARYAEEVLRGRESAGRKD